MNNLKFIYSNYLLKGLYSLLLVFILIASSGFSIKENTVTSQILTESASGNGIWACVTEYNGMQYQDFGFVNPASEMMALYEAYNRAKAYWGHENFVQIYWSYSD